MSIEPPKSSRSSGPIVVLVFISVLLLVIVLIFGMLAFVIDRPGSEDKGPDPATALSVEEFTIVDTATGESSATIHVDIVVTNTSDKPVENAQVIVQCEDGGYASAITNVPRLESETTAVVPIQLSGTGNPTCKDPNISFSSRRPGD